MISLVVLLAESIPQLRPLRVLRVMRVLRPLRLISRNAGMRLIITSLFKAMPAVSNVFGVVLSLQLVFAILGMQVEPRVHYVHVRPRQHVHYVHVRPRQHGHPRRGHVHPPQHALGRRSAGAPFFLRPVPSLCMHRLAPHPPRRRLPLLPIDARCAPLLPPRPHQMFSGTFGFCNNPAVLTREECSPLPAVDAHRLAALDGRSAGGASGAGEYAGEYTGEGLAVARRVLKGGGDVAAWDPTEPLHWTEAPALGSFDNFVDAMRLLCAVRVRVRVRIFRRVRRSTRPRPGAVSFLTCPACLLTCLLACPTTCLITCLMRSPHMLARYIMSSGDQWEAPMFLTLILTLTLNLICSPGTS